MVNLHPFIECGTSRKLLLDKLIPNAWRKHMSYGTLALIAAALLFLANEYYGGNYRGSRVITAIATALMGVWITLVVVQWAIRKDRDRRIGYFEAATYAIAIQSIYDISVGALAALIRDEEFTEECKKLLSTPLDYFLLVFCFS